MYYAALMETYTDWVRMHALDAETYDDASGEVDDLLLSDDLGYRNCIWIMDLTDMRALAQFFGKHRDEFSIELS